MSNTMNEFKFTNAKGFAFWLKFNVASFRFSDDFTVFHILDVKKVRNNFIIYYTIDNEDVYNDSAEHLLRKYKEGEIICELIAQDKVDGEY